MKWYVARFKQSNTLKEYTTWDVFKSKVINVKGVTFKSFDTEKEADKWLNQPSVLYRTIDTTHEPEVLYLYVDGSFSPKRNISGWGWVAVLNEEKISEDFGYLKNITKSRNIIGELAATMYGITWAVRTNREIVVVHDYIGIANWALGYWNATKEVAVEYQEYMSKYETLMKLKKLRFEKVSGHKGIKWNEYVDNLTRRGYPV